MRFNEPKCVVCEKGSIGCFRAKRIKKRLAVGIFRGFLVEAGLGDKQSQIVDVLCRRV